MDRENTVQKRSKLHEESERKSRLALIEDLILFLDEESLTYEVKFDDSVSDWISANFPLLFSGIDWENSPESIKTPFREIVQRDNAISDIVSTYFAGEDVVSVTWSNALRPTVLVSAEVLTKHPAAFADEDSDMWVVQLDKQFCLECCHEGYIGYKRVS